MERRATARSTARTPTRSPTKQEGQRKPTWGRFTGDFLSTVGCVLILATTPFLALYFNIICEHFDCSFAHPLLEVFVFRNQPLSYISQYLPSPTWTAVKILAVWYTLQVAFAIWLPGKKGTGIPTPAGYLLEYKVNGLLAWFVSNALYLVGSYLGWWNASLVYDNHGALLVLANVIGYTLATFAFVKAYLFPSHPEDRKFSGNFFYDYYMGIEFNPRIGPIDFKLFFNGRPGIVAWTIINMSFAAAQYNKHGFITNSMVIVNILHAIYVVDFFYNEDWYLRTIDICHDHFGWMLGWGDSVWLPFTYTLQGYFLVTHPVILSNTAAAAILALGFGGYYIFRAANHQRDFFRSHDGKCNIWGKPATYIDAKYVTSDGKLRNSKLLTSGWWGLSRHFNYIGDLMISLAYCLPCGFTHLLPYEYIIYMTMLLVHRAGRDDLRCAEKYGPYWAEYKKQVPYAIVPYFY